MREFEELSRSERHVMHGGFEFARAVLEETLGASRASQLTEKLRTATETRGFNNLDKVDVSQLVNFLAHEHPQTIALVMAHLDTRQGAKVLLALPETIRAEVVYRIARLDKTTPEVIAQIEKQLNAQLASSSSSVVSTALGGTAQVAEVLNQVDRGTEQEILDALALSSPELAEEIKNLMFVFDDIQTLDDRALQRVLREIETKDLSMALRACQEAVKEAFFRNMSERARLALKEDMEFMGPVRLRDVQEAQRHILDAIRRLEDEGAIIVRGQGTADMVV
jgi:flagellar motor switch protein FliG